MAGIIDTIYTFRFLKILSTKWENTAAFKLGIIDENGKSLKKSEDLTTTEEKKAYTPFVRLIFKLKRMMGTIPGGKSAVARYGAALALIKEHKEEIEEQGMNLQQLEESLKKYTGNDSNEDLNEEVTNVVGGIAGKDQLLGKGKKGEVQKRKKKEDEEESGEEKDDKNESEYKYQLIGNILIRIDEKKRVVKRRIVKGKRQKKREYASGKGSRVTRTGKRKMRGAALAKKRKSLKKAMRKAHTGSAKAKRKRSMKKSRKYSK